MRTDLRMTTGQWLLLVLLSLLWGISFFQIEIALREAEPLTIVFMRIALAAVALWLVAALSGRLVWPSLGTWGALLVMGAINNVLPFFLIIQGQVYINSSVASICNATLPLFTVLLAHFFTTDELLSRRRLVGVAVGLAGVVVLVGPGALDGVGEQTLGQLAVLGAALCYAVATIFGKRLRSVSPLIAAAGMLSCATLLMLPMMLGFARPPTLAFNAATWASLLSLSVLSTALAYLVYFRLLAGAGATNVTLVTLLVPVTAILLGVLALGETLEAWTLYGVVLIFAGLVVIDGRVVAWVRGR